MDASLLAVAFLLIGLSVVAIFKSKITVLNMVVGGFTVPVGLSLLTNADTPAQPYFSMLVVLLGVIVIAAAAVDLKSHGHKKYR